MCSSIQDRLRALADPGYAAFQQKLMPTVPPETVIGVRMPQLRRLARSLLGTEEAAAFLAVLPHETYEENNLHGLLICAERDYGRALEALERFLPYVDNWATCDLLHPKAFDRRPEALPGQLERWVRSGHTYTVRFGLGMLMRLYLDEAFRPAYLELAASVVSKEYYVNMMAAWYFATALAKQYEAALPYLAENRLDLWVHNKTIQKAVESFRIPAERKAYLRTLRRRDKAL